MLKRALVILVLALAQARCSVEEGSGPYKLTPLTPEARQELEELKREFLQIEDLRIGTGPLAAWNRQVKATIEVRYVNGTLAYKGSIKDNVGFEGSVFILNATSDSDALVGQTGVWLGLNGMGVGGKRKFTIEPKLVCDDGKATADSSIKCLFNKEISIRKEKLIVEATLTDSCVPILLRAIYLPATRYMLERQVWCRNHDEPLRSPTDPIWKFY